MKSFYINLLLAFLVGVQISYGQQTNDAKDSPNDQLAADTNHVNSLIKQANFYFFTNPDSSLILSTKAIELAQQLKFSRGEATALNLAGEGHHMLGDLPQSLEMHFRALEINLNNKDKKGEAITRGYIGFSYVDLNEYRQALPYLNEARIIFEKFEEPVNSTLNLANIGGAYEGLNMLDSALFFHKQALARSAEIKFMPLTGLIYGRLGMTYAKSGQHEQALRYYKEVLPNAILPSRLQSLAAESHYGLKQWDSSFHYARLSFASSSRHNQIKEILIASNMLGKLFRRSGMTDSTIYYQDISIALNDSLFGPTKIRQLQLLALNEQKRQQEVLQDKERYKNKTKTFALLIGIGFFLLIAIILLRNNRQKQRTNKVLEHTLDNLRSTQSQLIQSEKMASLGELTAGIAHEIQNPLNFVNNFSEVNAELIQELKAELKAGNHENVISIANDVADNEKKINHHGKRADGIVKNMLQHSRSSSGKKEPTDINKLADEYLKLAYHGLRAKDSSFNASMKTDFDESIGKIDIVPQDIGRVILNLITNAFYAVTEKKKQLGDGYEPIVTVSTRKNNVKVEIRVRDNGNGISQKVSDKIFQPFFTTKPTGQGTGLGLSLSYDIVKAHGGEIKVETKQNEGSEFTITL